MELIDLADDLSDRCGDDRRFGSEDRAGRSSCTKRPLTAGLGAEISSLIQEHCFLYLEAPGAACDRL